MSTSNYKTLTFSGSNQVWSTDDPGAAAYGPDGYLYLFYNLNNQGSVQLMCMSALGSSNLATSASWSVRQFAPTFSDGSTPSPSGAPAVVVTPSHVHVFWCDARKNSLACATASGLTVVSVLDSSGRTIDTSHSEVAVCALGDRLLVVLTDTSHNRVLYFSLAMADLDEAAGTWKASGASSIDQAAFQSNGDPMSRSVAVASSYGYDGDKRQVFLVQTLQFAHSYFLHVLSVDMQKGLPQKILQGWGLGEGQTGGSMMTRDPAARVRYYFGSRDDATVRAGLVTFRDGDKLKVAATSPARMFGDDKTTSVPPCGAFVPVQSGTDPTRWTVREVVFHADNTSDDSVKFIKLQVADYGTVKRTDQPVIDMTAQNNKVQLLGYILSPPPLAVRNFMVQPSWFFDSVGRVVYGRTSGGTSASQTRISGSVGVGASVSIGGGFNIEDIVSAQAELTVSTSLTVGWGSTTGSKQERTSEVTLSAGWEVQTDASGHADWKGQGFALFRNIAIQPSVYDFLDGNDSKPAANAYSNVVFTPQDTEVQISPFRTRLLDPDDITSYQSDRLTTAMRGAALYNGNDYVNDVLAPNSLRYDSVSGAFSGAGTHAGLPFAWGSGATSISKYTEVATSYQESVWSLGADTQVDFSAQAGLFVTASTDVWSKLTTTMEAVSSTELQQSWGLSMEINVPPPNPSQVPDPIYSYSGTMYFCPPPTSRATSASPGQWTRELLQALQGGVSDFDQAMANNLPWDQNNLRSRIDPNSQCWKICFTAANIVGR